MRTGFCVFCLCLVTLFAISSKKSINTIPSYTGTPTLIPSWTGYLQVRPSPDNAHVWYWFFPSLNDPTKDPLIIWLSGGPGCSSMIALFAENGPYRADSANSISFNQNTWIQRSSVLYLDQVIGSGLSFTSGLKPNSTSTVVGDIGTALVEFFTLFPQFKQSDLYMAGDSYSGKFIPSYFETFNFTTSSFNFKGVLLGNPSFDPIRQYSIYADLGYTSGIVDYRNRVEMNILYSQCIKDVQSGNYKAAHNTSCTPIIFDKLVGINGLSPFDTREVSTTQNYFDSIATYLNRVDVRVALSVNTLSSNYVNCDDTTFQNFIPDMFQGVSNGSLPNMISGMRVLLYSAQFDLRVGVLGTVEYLRYMNWSGRSVFNSMKQTLFSSGDGAVVGQFKSYLGLTHMTIYGASHIAPRTAALATLTMVSRFIGPTQNLCETSLPNCMDRAYECPGNCSSHGSCFKYTCACIGGYTSQDCSIGTFAHDVKSESVFSGTIVGKDVNIYRLKLFGVDTMLNAYVTLTRTSDIGTSYVFVSAHGADDIPTDDQIRNLVYSKMLQDTLGAVVNYGFTFMNTSAEPIKITNAKGMQLIRGAPNVLTIVVYNSDDFVTTYNLRVRTEVGSGEIRLLGVFTTLCVFVGLIVISQLFLLISGWQIVKEAKNTVLMERLE
jgi:carboxypeptidase C (cathepsin A)